MQRKGNAVIDGALTLALVVTLVFAVIIIKGSILDPINTEIQADDDFSAQAKAISSKTSGDYGNVWDNIIPFLLAFMWAAALVSSQFIDTKPVFMVFSIVGLIIIMVVAATMEQAYEDQIADPEYSGFEVGIPKIHFIMENIVWIIMLMVFSVMVALYGKGM